MTGQILARIIIRSQKRRADTIASVISASTHHCQWSCRAKRHASCSWKSLEVQQEESRRRPEDIMQAETVEGMISDGWGSLEMRRNWQLPSEQEKLEKMIRGYHVRGSQTPPCPISSLSLPLGPMHALAWTASEPQTRAPKCRGYPSLSGTVALRLPRIQSSHCATDGIGALRSGRCRRHVRHSGRFSQTDHRGTEYGMS